MKDEAGFLISRNPVFVSLIPVASLPKSGEGVVWSSGCAGIILVDIAAGGAVPSNGGAAGV